MKNLDDLWALWDSGNQKLVVELIKGLGLDVKLVLNYFWKNKLSYDYFEDKIKNRSSKHIEFSTLSIGITSIPRDSTILVYLNIEDNYINDTCFTCEGHDHADAWITASGTVLHYSNFEEAEEAALEHFIKLIESNERVK